MASCIEAGISAAEQESRISFGSPQQGLIEYAEDSAQGPESHRTNNHAQQTGPEPQRLRLGEHVFGKTVRQTNKHPPVGGGTGGRCFDVTGLGGGCPACHTSVGWEEECLGTRSLNFQSAFQAAAGNKLDVAPADAEILQLAAGQAGKFVNRAAVGFPVVVFAYNGIKHFVFPYWQRCCHQPAASLLKSYIFHQPNLKKCRVCMPDMHFVHCKKCNQTNRFNLSE